MAWEPQANVPGGFADEAALLDALGAGRRKAFEALHEAYAARIYNLALRIVDNPADAQDISQEVLIKVYRHLPHERPDNLTAWLYRVTVNAAFDHLRRHKRRRTDALEPGHEPAAIIDEYERAELRGHVEDTLRSLPKRQQVALVLREVHGLSVGETATALGVTRGSADVLLSRARTGFRRLFLARSEATETSRCRVAMEALAAGVGSDSIAEQRARLLAHARTCPDCRRTVDLWGAAPVALGLLLHQVTLPASLGAAATFSAASAAGVAIPSAGVTAGLLAKLGSAVSVKVATVAATATVVVGAAGYEIHREASAVAARPPVPASSASTPGSPGISTAPVGRHADAAAMAQARATSREREREQARERRRAARATAGRLPRAGADGAGAQQTRAQGGGQTSSQAGAGGAGSSAGGQSGAEPGSGGGSGTGAGGANGSGADPASQDGGSPRNGTATDPSAGTRRGPT